tara:strand:+ start:108129 stop:109385 length:1257 start_codon:yes stop_codon:yes gene_type:complete
MVELLMPAGSPEKLKYAINFGADAVYAGLPLFSLRARENEFSLSNIKSNVDWVHSQGKKIYLTANIFARNLKLSPFRQHFSELLSVVKPDGLIMSDPGLMNIAKSIHPDIPIHLSVQANCMNWEAIKFWQSQGVTRVILSRELRLEEIQEMKQRVPEIELEAFVHGSICIAYSGRCLMSHYMSYRDANQGVCDNSCRYPYRVHAEETPKELWLEDTREPGSLYRLDEDEHGSYLFNAKDLCLIEHLKELRDAGVCSFKIEGRTKSVFYAAIVAKIYRQAIDDMIENKPFRKTLLAELDNLSHKGFHKGFFKGDPGSTGQNYTNDQANRTSTFLGIVVQSTATESLQAVQPKSKINKNEVIQALVPKDKGISTMNVKIVDIEFNGHAVDTVHSGQSNVRMGFDKPIPEGSILCAKNSFN